MKRFLVVVRALWDVLGIDENTVFRASVRSIQGQQRVGVNIARADEKTEVHVVTTLGM